MKDPQNGKDYSELPYINDAWEKLYWGLLGYSFDDPDSEGELRDLTPVEIYSYVAAFLSSALNRPAPIDEIACVIVDVYHSTLISYGAACSTYGDDAADKEYLPVLLRLEEAWLMVETEAGALMPPEFRFARCHDPIFE
jgi:hypothetical protein